MGVKTKCEYCKKKIDVAATRCPYCQAEFTPEQVAKRKKEATQAGIGCAVVIVLLALIGTCSGGSNKKTAALSEGTATYAPQYQEKQPIAAVPDPLDALTPAQRNAVRSARQYLDMSGFSRAGLIQQLSSNAGEAFDKADATAAVDSLDVDWNEEAAESAKAYVEMSGFSCRGLIEQLSSSAGEKFTRSQAEYGAKQAGAC
ncbi:MAG: Ltp family lipoprotein [Novosphingobium sp.]